MSIGVLRKKLFTVWRSEPNISKILKCVRNYISTKYNINECDEQVIENLKK